MKNESKSESPLIGEQKQFTIHELRAAYYAGVNKLGFDEWHKKFQEMYAPLKSSERSAEDINDAEVSVSTLINLLRNDELRPIFLYHNQGLVERLKELLKAKEESLPEATDLPLYKMKEKLSHDYAVTFPEYQYQAARSGYEAGFVKAQFHFESKEDNKAFGEQDMMECWQASREHVFYLNDPAQTKYYPNFKEWLKSYTPKPE